ncbi:MAG: hypothetical protein H0X63_07120 [Flavobacteriales bacterium]|nr:hypothetical protein [Flavobacteriales bacterium]
MNCNKFPILILLCFLFINIGCNVDNISSDKNFNNFKSYLIDTFDFEIPIEKSVFLIIPSVNCGGCKDEALKIFADYQDKYSHLYLIIGKKTFTKLNIGSSTNVFIDEYNVIDRVNIDVQNVALIVTQNEKIILKQYIKPGDSGEMNSKLMND